MIKRLKRLWVHLQRFENKDSCTCNIHLCTTMSVKDLKIIKDALTDFDPEQDMYDEKDSAFQYMYDMIDIRSLKEDVIYLLRKRI
jgi:hypothetical protein